MDKNKLHKLFIYHENNGLFFWLKPGKGKNTHRPAGYYEKNRYVQIGIDNKIYLGHRLAWLYVYGKWPDGQIDHINGNKHDNRIENLRDVTCKENGQNRHGANKNNKSTSLLGAYYANGRFFSMIMQNRKSKYLGTFESAELAHTAYCKAKSDRDNLSA